MNLAGKLEGQLFLRVTCVVFVGTEASFARFLIGGGDVTTQCKHTPRVLLGIAGAIVVMWAR